MQRRVRWPSPATTISLIALFVALGGTSYGLARNSIDSGEIKNNTVRSKDIRNGAVASTDLKNNGVSGADVNEESLGKVPNATAADAAGTAGDAAALGGVPAANYATKGLEPVHIIGHAGEPQFQNDWNFFGDDIAGFWKDQNGVVYFQGALDPNNDPDNGTTAFTLPAGYRPPVSVTFTGLEGPGPDAEDEDCRIVVFEDGQVQVNTIPATTGDIGSCQMNGILFRTQ